VPTLMRKISLPYAVRATKVFLATSRTPSTSKSMFRSVALVFKLPNSVIYLLPIVSLHSVLQG